MKKLITNEQLKRVNKIRDEIRDLMEREDYLYRTLAEGLGFVLNSDDDFLFDYVFNCEHSSNSEYEAFILKNLHGND
jgi:hypothetical protein